MNFMDFYISLNVSHKPYYLIYNIGLRLMTTEY